MTSSSQITSTLTSPLLNHTQTRCFLTHVSVEIPSSVTISLVYTKEEQDTLWHIDENYSYDLQKRRVELQLPLGVYRIQIKSTYTLEIRFVTFLYEINIATGDCLAEGLCSSNNYSHRKEIYIY